MESNQTIAPNAVGLAARIAAVPVKQILALGIGLALLVATLAVSIHWNSTSDYKVLFANMSDRDGGAVSAALTQLNIPYRLAEGGGAILVPSAQVHDARLRLASQGLPRGGTVGFELIENQKFGVTQFQERLNFQRGLEGELSRSIQSLSAVRGARVHLALPTQNGFLREQLRPSASVLLSLHAGRSLDRGQIAGIVHLVASSVADLSPKQVSVIGPDGELLSGESDAANALDSAQLSQIRRLESNYVQRILDLVEPMVGRGNVRAQISAAVDFTQTESTAEEFKPNQGKETPAVRSQQVTETLARDAAGAGPAQGIPGALSNQPPTQPSAPINAPAQALQAAGQAGANGANTVNSRRDAMTNYEVDKTVRVTRNASGNVKRLSAAVIVNHRKIADGTGKVTLAPLSDKEIEGINALVREAIGFSKERGDSLNVVNTPFTQDESKPVELALWQQPENIALAKEVGKHVAIVILGVLTIFMVIRPALKTIPAAMTASVAGAGAAGKGNTAGGSSNALLNETVGGAVALPPPSVPEMQRMVRENPAAVAEVVRTWAQKNG